MSERAPAAGEHAAGVQHVSRGQYDSGWRAVCSCGWRSPRVRGLKQGAQQEAVAHMKDPERGIRAV